jgi:hypothetical protein
MTRTISLITATVGAALLFAVPAWGDNWGADKAQPTLAQPDPMIEDGFAQAVANAEQIRIVRMLDARERGFGVSTTETTVDARSEGLNRLYGLGEYSNPIDARERALVVPKTTPVVSQPQGFDARSDGMNRLYGLGEYAAPVVADFDRFHIDTANEPVTVSATSSSRDIEWPTIGYGLGIALVLMLGLGLALKATHTRPFAH